MNDQRTFAMFCTVDPLVLFAVVTDEIAAVEAFRGHVADWGDDHVQHIHMEPMRAEWSDTPRGWSGADAEPIRASFGPNLFRQPAQVSS